jgi:hypothetical protein
MTDSRLRTCLEELVQEALEQSELGRVTVGPGQAFFHPERDSQITGLGGFASAVDQLELVRQSVVVAGAVDARGAVIQFIYDYFGQLDSAGSPQEAFEGSWKSFWDELQKAEWTYLAICYLENFISDETVLDFGNGLTIYHRSSYGFRDRGWSDFQLEQLQQDWQRETHVLVAEYRVTKSAENLRLASAAEPVSNIVRMLQALRLTKEGSVHIAGVGMIGRILTTRPAGSGFSPSRGAAMHGTQSGREFEDAYSLSVGDINSVRSIYDRLFMCAASDPMPYNLDIALQFFRQVMIAYQLIKRPRLLI